MKHTHRGYVKMGFFFMALAVGLGAFGAHNLEDLIDEKYLAVWETGVRYLVIHASALIILGLFHRKFVEKFLNMSLRLFILGIILFSGSLLLLSTSTIWSGSKQSFLGAITPIGGLAFIAGWLLLFFKGFETDKDTGGITFKENKSSDSRSHRKHRHSSSKSTSSKNDSEPPVVA